jgi:hypothetical protein
MVKLLALVFLLGSACSAFAADLVLKRVMLSSAGVGYFEYEAQLDGAATLGLDVPLDQVDDVLTSLAVFDSTGGVGAVELPGRDNTRASFGDLPFGPEALRSPVDYLNSLQGVAIAVQGPRPMTGRIVHAERINEPVATTQGQPTASVPRTRVTLLGADGMRQFVLEDADSIQVADPTLRERIGRALESLRREASQSMRHITLRSSGTGQRTVRVGYVSAAPLWKASYRLVLPAKDGDTARLQGWAVLENQSGADWDGVALTLQYGNPVTFRQAIYRSYFVQRPEVPVEVLGRILPNVDTRARPAELAKAAAPASAARAFASGAAPPPMAPAQPAMAAPSEAVQATEAAEETIFQLPTPVSLVAGHSANVPIIDRSVPATRVDLATGSDPHPLSAVRITNDTGTSLPAGVLTLYDAAGAAMFAGDARLGGLPAGENRLLSFAQDLRTSVERDSSGETTLASLTAADGVLHISSRQREVLRFTITAPANEPRQLLLEIPRDGRTLSVEGGPIRGTEETATAWRLPIALKPGEIRKLTAYADRLEREDTALLADDAQVVVRLLNEQSLAPAARAALQRLATLRQDEAAKRTIVNQLKAQQAAILQDEERIRRNLAAVAANDALHTRLTRALDADETKLDQLGQGIDQATAAADKAHQTLADAAGALKL